MNIHQLLKPPMVSQCNMAANGSIHLETIYEESDGGISSSAVEISQRSSIRQQTPPPANQRNYRAQGLISARTIPSVDFQKKTRLPQRVAPIELNKTIKKPPIEVHFRDGTKRLIHPAITEKSIDDRRKSSVSSKIPLSINSKSMINPSSKKNEILLTIITTADLRQAGISPTSTTSSDVSETMNLTKSNSNTSLDTLKTMNDVSTNDATEAPSSKFSEDAPSISIPISSISTTKTVKAQVVAENKNSAQIAPFNRISREIPVKKSFSTVNPAPPVAIVPPNKKLLRPSLEINIVNSPSEVNRSKIFSSTEKNRSAFRPFTKPQVELSAKKSRFVAPEKAKTFNSSLNDRNVRSIIMNLPEIHLSDKGIQTSMEKKIFLEKNVPPKMISTKNENPTNSLKWHSVTSKSLYDVPRLSSRYADIPLRITIPVSSTPDHNQKKLSKPDRDLEKRLKDAGLSPETIALYERILEVAQARPSKNLDQ